MSKIVSSCFYQLRRLRQLKRHVNVTTMKLLISAFILSRLDYCNVLLSGLPMSTIHPLHRVQSAAARLALGPSSRNHVRAALKKLHWLPVTNRIQYNLSLMMFWLHSHQCPDYMSNTVSLVSDDPDVGDSVQLPVLITTFRALEPNSETGCSRSLVQKCEKITISSLS